MNVNFFNELYWALLRCKNVVKLAQLQCTRAHILHVYPYVV